MPRAPPVTIATLPSSRPLIEKRAYDNADSLPPPARVPRRNSGPGRHGVGGRRGGARRHPGAASGRCRTQTPVEVFTLANAHGLEVRAINYGGIITSIRTPDRAGRFDDIVLGVDRLDDYRERTPYFGAIIGRYGNRIAKGRFTLDGTSYTLATNDGPNHLHGGLKGFDKAVWHAEPFEQGGSRGRRVHARQPGRRRGLSGPPEREGHLHAHRSRRARDRLRGDDRRADADQPDQPQLLQSRRRRAGHPRARADDRRGSLSRRSTRR